MPELPPQPTERELFDQAMALPEADDLGAFLEQACQGNQELAHRVAALVESSKASSQIFPDETSGHLVGVESAGDTIGNFRLVKLLGEGAFGMVWLAEQHVPVKRKVALKILKLGLDTEAIVRRFQLERQALAMMDHPNIANIYDAGATASGRSYFVMEHLDGESLFDYADARRLSFDQRLKLCRQVIAAVQHAHQRGIIHRDLKPSNILVVEIDGKPMSKVIDFGIAKLVATPANAELTISPESWGTPAFMSPEQLAGQQVDTRSDVFTLGVILYQLLCGFPPSREGEKEGSILPPSRCRVVAEDEQMLAANNRSTTPRELKKQLAGELDWIVMKAMEIDRERRYGSAAELLADLTRFLQNEPVFAAAPSLAYTFGKFVSRHRVLVIATSLILLSLVGGLLVALHGLSEAKRQALVAERQTGIARSQTDLARTSSDILLESIADFDPADSDGKPTIKSLLDRIRANAEKRVDSHPEVAIDIWKAIASANEGFSYTKEARELHRKAFDLSKTVNGARHIETAKLALRLAVYLPYAGEDGERFVLQKLAHEVFSEVWGDEDSRTLRAKTMIGYWHMKSMQDDSLDQAQPWFEEVLEITRRYQGKREYDMERAIVSRNLSKLNVKKGNREKAKAFAQESYELHSVLFEPNDFRRLRAQRDLVREKIWNEEYDEAIRDLSSQRKLLTAHYGEIHDHLAEIDILLGFCFRKKEEYETAALHYKKSHEIFVETGGPDSHDAFEVACALIAIFEKDGKPEEAARFRKSCEEVFSRELDHFEEQPGQALEGITFLYKTFAEVLGNSDRDALKMAKIIEEAQEKLEPKTGNEKKTEPERGSRK